MGGACCYYGVCCPPGSREQAQSLADATGIDLEAAAKVTGRFRLVPLDAPAALHERLDDEINGYLREKGLPTT